MGEWDQAIYNMIVKRSYERLCFTHALTQYMSEKREQNSIKGAVR